TDYRDMTTRLALLHEKLGKLAAEKLELQEELANAPQGGSYSANVAALLGEGDSTSSTVGKRARLRELVAEERDLEQAVSIVERRRAERISPASVAACNAARPEYGKRVAVFIEALRAAKDAYNAVDEVPDALERQGAQIGYLHPVRVPFFAGNDNAMTRLIAEAKEAGHVG
ncbi:hypothetical protein, partial [Gellertiella hungarica]|nr:hypothetical protein [Gellertiella hungarica]